MNSLYGIVIGTLGVLLKTKLDIAIARFSYKHFTVAPIILCLIMLGNGLCNILYLIKAFEGLPEEKTTNKNLSIIIAVFLTLISAGAQLGFGFVARGVHRQFRDCLEIYVFFMLKFQETPRSKAAKKYLPPLDILREETASHYAETVHEGSLRHNRGKALSELNDNDLTERGTS